MLNVKFHDAVLSTSFLSVFSNFIKSQLTKLLGTFKNKAGSKYDGNCEKYYFSFSFSVLDHR